MPEPPEIIRTMRCSTFHLTMDDLCFLAIFPGRTDDNEGNFTITVAPWLHGKPPEASETLNAVMHFAASHNCQRVAFDEDGPELRGFPLFDHDND